MSDSQVLTIPFVNAENWLKEHTHGHVVPNNHARLANCMGPADCETCKVELQLKRLIDADRAAFEGKAGTRKRPDPPAKSTPKPPVESKPTQPPAPAPPASGS